MNLVFPGIQMTQNHESLAFSFRISSFSFRWKTCFKLTKLPKPIINFLFSMKIDSPNDKKKRLLPKTYKKITYEQRLQIIDLVTVQGLSYKKAGKKYSFCGSTVKTIIHMYKKEGRVFQTKAEQKKRRIAENILQSQEKVKQCAQKKEAQENLYLTPNFMAFNPHFPFMPYWNYVYPAYYEPTQAKD